MLFYQYVNSINYNERSPYEIANKLGLSCSYVNKLIRMYDCQNIINYKSSKYENILDDLLKQYGIYAKRNDRTIIKPYEIDLLINTYNFGIEFNGDFYHCYIDNDDDERHNNKFYHQNKSLLAQEKGIFIYHIFEYEWNDERKRPIIESQLRNLCHKNETKVYARNCEIREINDNNLIRKFLDTNHLQGFRKSNVKLGLFYKDELVSLMTFGKPYLNKSSKYDWELYRFCNKLNISVIGGFDKLFKYFIKNYSPDSILTYSDFAKGNGYVYEKLGFKKLELTKPNYVWKNKNEILSRYQTQMKDEIKIMESKRYDRIFDCGSYKWLWKNNI